MQHVSCENFSLVTVILISDWGFRQSDVIHSVTAVCDGTIVLNFSLMGSRKFHRRIWKFSNQNAIPAQNGKWSPVCC